MCVRRQPRSNVNCDRTADAGCWKRPRFNSRVLWDSFGEKKPAKNQKRADACWANSPPIKLCLKPEQQELNLLSTLLGRNAELRHPKRHLHVTTESVA